MQAIMTQSMEMLDANMSSDALASLVARAVASVAGVQDMITVALTKLINSIAFERPAQEEYTGWVACWRRSSWRVSGQQYMLLGLCLAALVLILLIGDRILAGLLSIALKRYTGTIKKDQVRSSIWRGYILVTDMHISPRIMDQLDLPMLTKQASVGSFRIALHWRRCRLDVVGIEISDVRLEAHPRVFPEPVTAADLDARLFRKKELLKLAYLDAVEAVLWKQDLPSRKEGVVEHLLWSVLLPAARILLTKLELSVERVSASYQNDSKVGDPHAELHFSVDSLRMVEAKTGEEVPNCRKLVKKEIRIRGVSLDVKHDCEDPPCLLMDESSRRTVSVLRRWSASAEIFCGHTPSRQQVWQTTITAGALIASVDELVQKALTASVSSITEFLKYQEFRGPRPQATVRAAPMLWWQHAGAAVLREFKKLSVGSTVLPPRLEERRAMRRRYVELYTEIHKAGGLSKIKKSLREQLAALRHLEARLGPEEIAQFRWWACARLRRGEARSRWFRKQEDPSESLRLQMQEIDAILSGARGIQRRGKARYRVVGLAIHCPKVSLLLSSGKDKDWGGEMSFLQIGARGERRQGAVLLEGTCRAMHLRDFQTARAFRSVELLRSPAGLEAATKIDCLTVKITKPSSKQEAAGQRLSCTVRLAPIDLIQEHGWLARLGRFFRQAVPIKRGVESPDRGPGQQPEHMSRQQLQYFQEQQSPARGNAATRYKASLADEVSDCAAKILARRARRTTRLPHLDFTMGDVRIIVPCHENEGVFAEVEEVLESPSKRKPAEHACEVEAHSHGTRHRHSLVVIMSGLHVHSDEYRQDLSKRSPLQELPVSKKAASEDELWMRSHHDSLLAPLRFDISKAALTLELFLARVGKGAHNDYKDRVPLIRRVHLRLSHALCRQPVSKIATKLVRMSVDVSKVELILSPFAFGELAHLASVVHRSEAEATYIMEGPLTPQETGPPPEQTKGGKGPVIMIQAKIPLFSLDAVRFLEFDPSGQAGPYGTCPESLNWLSEDQAVFRAAMHNIDVRFDRWPRKRAICVSLGNLVVENLTERDKPDSTYRYFLPPLKQSFMSHFTSSYVGPAFQRWRLYMKQSRNLADDVPKAELERALRRSKAQMNLRIQKLGSLTDIDVDVAFLPVCCNLEGMHDLAQFITHALEAIRVAWDLHSPPKAPPPPGAPASPRPLTAHSRKSSRERLVRLHSLKLAEAEDALFTDPMQRMGSLERRPLETPRGSGSGNLLVRRMSRPMPKLPAPVAALEKETRNVLGGGSRPSVDPHGRDDTPTALRHPARFSGPLPGSFNRAFSEKGKAAGPRVVRWEEEETDRDVDMTPQPVRTTSFPGDVDDLPEEHHGSHPHEGAHRGTRWEEHKPHRGAHSGTGEEEEERTLQVRVRVTCVRLTIAIARETFTSLVVQDVMCSLSHGDSTDLVLHVDDLQLLDLKAASNRYRYVIRPSGQGEHCVCLELSSRPRLDDTPAQTLVWLDCHHLRATVLVRYIKDVLQCIAKTREVAKECTLLAFLMSEDSSASSPKEAAAPSPPVFLLITACDFYAEMPRHSWSEDMYILHAKKVTAMLPTSADQDAALKVCLGAAKCHLGADWADDPLWENFEGAPAAQGTIAAHLTEAMVYWRRETPDGEVCERRVVGSAEISAVIQAVPFRLRVKWPDVHVVFGDIQYSLLMGIIFENSSEPSTFQDMSREPSLVGQPSGRFLRDAQQDLEPPPEVPATWELLFELGHAAVVIERTPEPIHQGFADPLAIVTLTSCAVVISEFFPPTKSEFLQIVVKSAGLRITDERFKRFSATDIVLVECPNNRFRTKVCGNQPPREPPGASVDHFIYNYTIKANGTHAMEITFLQDAQMWPHLNDCGFIQGIIEVFTRYFMAPTCALGPQDLRPDAWFYVNVIFKDRETFFPVLNGPVEPRPPQEVLDAIAAEKAQSADAVREFLPGFGVWTDELDNVLTQLTQRGILFMADYLRVGYFWGGDGEKNVKLDLINAQAHVVDEDQAFAQSLFLGPTTVRVRSTIRCPKAPVDRRLLASTAVEVLRDGDFPKNNAIALHAVYSHVPLLTDVAKVLRQRLSELGCESATAELAALATPFLPSAHDFKVTIGDFRAALCDDRLGAAANVLSVRLGSVDLYLKRERLLRGRDATQLGLLKMNLAVDYLNSAVEEMEAILEPWPVVVDMKAAAGGAQVAVSSSEAMSCTVSPVQLLSLGDALSYAKELQAKLAGFWGPPREPLQVPGISRRSLRLQDSVVSQIGSEFSAVQSPDQSGRQAGSGRDKELDGFDAKRLRSQTMRPRKLSRNSTSGRRSYPVRAVAPIKEDEQTHLSRYRIINQTGLALFYWAEEESGERRSHQVAPGEDLPLAVEPVEKVVTLRDSRKVRARTISVQLRGNWAPVNDVVVDKVGKSVMELRAPYDEANVPLILDVTLVDRTKLLSVHSTLQLVNETSHPLHLWLHLPTVPSPAKERAIGPLRSGDTCYLPITAARGGQLYLQAEGYLRAEKDVIQLSAAHLVEQQGLLACPSLAPSGVPFYCCLQVKPVEEADLISAGAVQEFCLVFRPPLVLENALPYEMVATVVDADSGLDAQCRIPSGTSADLYNMTLEHKLEMSAAVAGFHTDHKVLLHLPPNRMLEDHLGPRPFLHELPGLRLPREMVLQPTGGLRKLRLQIENRATSRARARRVVIFSKYWIMNRTNLLLYFAARNQTKEPTVCSPQRDDDDELRPVLYGCGGGSKSIVSLPGTRWSKNIPIDSVGIIGAVQVTSDLTKTHQKVAMRYELGVQINLAPSPWYHRTKIITITPRFVLMNKSGIDIQYRQVDTASIRTLCDGVREAYHWDHDGAEDRLQIRPLDGVWDWSGSFEIDKAGEFGIRVRNAGTREYSIFVIDVSLNGASALITFELCDNSDQASQRIPYRVENRCARMAFQISQKNINAWQLLESKQAIPYAWDQPKAPNLLVVQVLGTVPPVVREYSLDDIKVRQPIVLRGPAKSGFLGNRGGSDQSDESLAEKIYVNVYADGATRVLSFSDVESQYSKETEEAERQLVVRRLQHLDARLALVRRLLEQQKDAAQDALADPALPLPVRHQEPIDPTTGERPPLVQSATSGADGTPPGSLLPQSPTASVEMHQRKLEQRRSFLERARRFSWGSHKDAPHAPPGAGSALSSRPTSPDLFFSPTGNDGERHIFTSPLVPMRSGGHRRNQSLPPEVEEAHIERPTLAETRRSLSIESRLQEAERGGGGLSARVFDPEDGLGHRHWMAAELERARAAGAGSRDSGPKVARFASGGPGFEGAQEAPAAADEEAALRKPADSGPTVAPLRPRPLSPLARSAAASKAAAVEVLERLKPKGGLTEVSGREMERLAVERQLPASATLDAGSSVNGGHGSGGQLTEVPSVSRDSDVIALSGTSSRQEGANGHAKSAGSGKGVLAAAMERLRMRKSKRRKEKEEFSRDAELALMNSDVRKAVQTVGVQPAVHSEVDGAWSPALAEAELKMSQPAGDQAEGDGQPRLQAFGSEMIQNPLMGPLNAQSLQSLSSADIFARESNRVLEAEEKGHEPDASLAETLSSGLEPATPERNGNGLASSLQRGMGGNRWRSSDDTDEQSEGGGELVRWGENGLFSNGHATNVSESDSDGSFLDAREDFPAARASSSRRQTRISLDSVEGFHKFAAAAIAAAAVSNALAATRGDRAEQFVQSAAGAAAATFLGGTEVVGDTLGAAVSRTVYAARRVNVNHLPVMRNPHTVWGPSEVEESPEVDPRTQRRSGGPAEEEVYRDSLAAHARKLSAVEEGEVLGGDLVVRLVSAEGLASKREHCNPYCVVEVELQRKRSAARSRTTQPQWNEELAFKAVRTSADLHVSVFSAERVGRDVFLGEVYLPLVSGDTLDRDLSWYTLGRRNARDRVSGRIRLATSWTATQLELMTLTVAQKEQELAQLEELVAINREMMDDREGGPQALVIQPPFRPLKLKMRKMRSLKKPALGPSRTAKKEEVGQLAVKVVEARHLSSVAAGGVPGLQRSCDAYVVVGCQGALPGRTAVVHDSYFPVWNEAFVFDGVPHSATLTAQVFSRRAVGADVFVGEVNVPVAYLDDTLPRYQWLTLQKRTEKDRVTGDLRLRLHWRSDVVATDEDQGHVLEVNLAGVGLSVVDHVPREIARVTLGGLHFARRVSEREQVYELTIGSAQVDNQLLTTTQPVVLIKAQNVRREREKAVGLPLVTLEWAVLGGQPGITYFKNFLFMLQEVDLHLEEDFVDALIAYAHGLPLQDLHDPKYAAASSWAEPSFLLQDAYSHSLLDPANWVTGKQGTRWYFERFCIRPVRVNVDFAVDPGWREADNAAWQVRKYASALGFPLVSFTTAPLRLNSLVLDNVFLNSDRLVRAVSNHYLIQSLQEIHKILGSLDLLGSPVSLVHSLGTGVLDFFTEPAKATTPEEFFKGAAAGSISLVKNSAYGVFNFMSLLMGSVSKGLAVLSLDDDFVQRFSERPANTQEAFIQGAQGVGQGCYEGIGGLVTSPLAGAEENGVVGCVQGTGHGLVGAVTKPLSGIFACMSKTAGGVGTGIRNIGDDVIRAPLVRVRPPRNFGREEGVQASSKEFQILATTLSLLNGGRYAGERIVDYLQIQEHKALLMTDQRVIYFDIRSHKAKAVVNYQDMVSVAGIEGRLEVAIAWTAILSLGGAKMRIPHQLRLKCRTRDLHQSLLVKLNRHAIAFKRGLTFTVDHQLTGPQDDADHRAETLARLSLFQKGHIRGRDSTRQLDRKRSIRQRLTSSSRRKQLAEDSEGEDDEEKEGEDEAAPVGATEGAAKVGEHLREEEQRSKEIGEGATDGPEERGGGAAQVPGLEPGVRLGSKEPQSAVRSGGKGLERSDAKEDETSKKEADRKGKAKAEEPSIPAKSFERSDSIVGGESELAQTLETIAELCNVVEMDPESTIATVGLLLRDAVGLPASAPIRPLLGSMLALCERAQGGAGPLRALGNLVAVAQRKVALSSKERLDVEDQENGGRVFESGESEEAPDGVRLETRPKKLQALGPRQSERTEGVSGAAKYRPRVGLRLEIDGTSQSKD